MIRPPGHPRLADIMELRSFFFAAVFASTLPGTAYELHEWGTFTTVAGSDGVLLTGLEREEEALPAYVRHHPGFMNHHPLFAGNFIKRMPVPVRNVKVKMETPVIYFHSDDGFRAKVKVGFEGGTISQWYPERSGGEDLESHFRERPADQRWIDFSVPYRGSIEWDVDVLSPEQSRDATLFKPDDLLQWTRARVPEANVVRAQDGETEGFLFYRGLGSFEPGLHASIDSKETLVLRNDTGGSIPCFVVYEKLEDGSTRWMESGEALAKGASIEIAENRLEKGAAGFDRRLYRSLRDHLANQGLLRSEADAMVQTWWQSYFERPGLRIFWVLPAERTNAILPLSVEPAPEKTVRVLVGRSEVIRPRHEREWLRLARSEDDEDKQGLYWIHSDRFGLAYQQRIEALTKTARR